MAKELASVELLARVDTLCLDKTGTITTGEISLADVEPVGDHTEADALTILGALGAADPAPNATLQAIADVHRAPPGWTPGRNLPFSSARKWAATEFDSRGTFYLGALTSFSPRTILLEPGPSNWPPPVCGYCSSPGPMTAGTVTP